MPTKPEQESTIGFAFQASVWKKHTRTKKDQIDFSISIFDFNFKMMIVYENTQIIVETISKDYLNWKGTLLAKCYSFKINILKE